MRVIIFFLVPFFLCLRPACCQDQVQHSTNSSIPDSCVLLPRADNFLKCQLTKSERTWQSIARQLGITFQQVRHSDVTPFSWRDPVVTASSLIVILIIVFAYIRLKKGIRQRHQSDQSLANNFEQNFLILESSEWMQAEEKIRFSEDNFRFALKAADASCWHYDWLHDQITVDVHLCGNENAPKTMEDFLSLVHPDDQKRVRNAMLEQFRYAVPFLKVDYRFLNKKTEEWIWLHSTGRPVEMDEQGRPIAVSGLTLNITNRQTLIKEARQALRLMSKVFEDSIDPIFIVDHETRKIINFNEATVSAYGYSKKELLGGYMALVTPESLIEQADILYNRCVAGEICRDIEWQRRKKNGEILPVLLSLSLLKDEDGKIHGIASMTRNISELKQAEQELKDYRDHLEDLVGERTADLVKAMKIAKKATRAKSDFLANISHEISTPLNAIVGFVHLALQTGLNSRQRDYLTKIQRSTKSLLNIINDILDFSKIEAAKLTLEVTEFYLGEVLDTVTNLIDIKAREKGLELIFNIEPQIPQALTGDPLRLSQVLINLIGNAVKFTDHGQILLSCCLVKNNEEGVELEFSIQDSGVGLTQEQQNRLFKAFSQADTSTTRKYGGTGLGLSISKNLVKMMGGRIQVQSQFGKGSIFSFTVCLKKAVSLPTSDLMPDASCRNNKILVIDDNSVCRMALVQMLESMTFRVAQASSIDKGRTACEKVWETRDCDLVLLDGEIPGACDVKGLEELKHDLNGLPRFLIMVPSYEKETFFHTAGISEFNEYLTKPVTPFLLLDSILRAFGKQGLYASYPDQGKKPVPDIESIRGARLLVAEDNTLNQQVIRDILEHSGVAVDIAENGRIALEMLKEHDYDGILMDINMPEMDGYTTARRIRQIYGRRDLPIIALTANTVPEDREKALAAGMDDQVGKPIYIHTLLAVLRKWVRCKQRDRLAPQPAEIKPPFIENFEESALAMLPGVDTRTDQEPDSATVGQLLLNLQKLLARDDSRAGEVVQELTVFFSGTDSSTLFSLLSRQVCAYNYDDAAKTLGRLFQELDKLKGG